MSYPNLEQLTVLYVEDDQRTREAVRQVLEKEAARVVVAENGEEGWELFQRERPDLVVTDIQMPKMDGLALTEKIRKAGETPVLITTAYSDENYLLRSIEIGVTGYVVKPVSPFRLLKKLDQLGASLLTHRLTERNQQLELSNLQLTAKTELIREIAHYWRQPLTAIMAGMDSVDDLLQYERDPVLVGRELEKIKKITVKLSRYIDFFREINRAESPGREKVPLRQLVGETIHMVDVVLEGSWIAVEIGIPEEMELFTSPAILRQILAYFINNTVDAVKQRNVDNPAIRIHGEEEGEQVVLYFSDNAGGIEEEAFANLFAPYYTTKFKGGDTGLSLFFAKVQAEHVLGGQLTAYNEGKGLTFRLALPKNPPEK